MGLLRQQDRDRVLGADDTSGQNHAHHPGAPYDGTVGRAAGHVTQQALVVRLDLDTRIAQALDPDHGRGAEVEQGAGRQPEEVDASGGHVLAEVTRGDLVPVPGEVVEELSVYQVDLPEVRLAGVSPHA